MAIVFVDGEIAEKRWRVTVRGGGIVQSADLSTLGPSPNDDNVLTRVIEAFEDTSPFPDAAEDVSCQAVLYEGKRERRWRTWFCPRGTR